MKKGLFLLVSGGLFLGPMTIEVAAYFEDQNLKAHNTTECQAFSQIEVPSSSFIPRRYKQEDSGSFYQHRAKCELSVQ